MDKLSIISPHQKMIHDEWIPKFKAYYEQQTGRPIEVEWIDQGGTTDNLKFVESEFKRSPNTCNIDVFWGGGLAPFIKMAGQGYLHSFKISDDILAHIPRTLSGLPVYDSEFRWYGSAMSSFGIVFNKLVFQKEKLPELGTWEDLGKPQFYSQVSAADPRHSGTAYMMYSIILQAYGWEKGWEILTRMSGNVRSFIQSSSKVIKAVESGEVAAGLAIDFYAWDLIGKHSSEEFGFVLPKNLTLINPDPIAILKGAPHTEAAKLFVSFVLKPENQKMWMLPAGAQGGPTTHTLGRIPVVPSLYDSVGQNTVVKSNPFLMESSFVYDEKKGEKLMSITNDLVGALLVDTNEDLRKNWKSVVDKGLKAQALAELRKMPVSEDEALQLSDKWDDQVLRNQKIAQWQTFAKQKYQKASGF
jgi:ABC-type Fe3+ transport system substrate-binding protein